MSWDIHLDIGDSYVISLTDITNYSVALGPRPYPTGINFTRELLYCFLLIYSGDLNQVMRMWNLRDAAERCAKAKRKNFGDGTFAKLSTNKVSTNFRQTKKYLYENPFICCWKLWKFCFFLFQKKLLLKWLNCDKNSFFERVGRTPSNPQFLRDGPRRRIYKKFCNTTFTCTNKFFWKASEILSLQFPVISDPFVKRREACNSVITVNCTCSISVGLT